MKVYVVFSRENSFNIWGVFTDVLKAFDIAHEVSEEHGEEVSVAEYRLDEFPWDSLRAQAFRAFGTQTGRFDASKDNLAG